MVFDFGGEIVGSIVFGDEIEVWNRSGMESCQKGFFPRIADRGGRKPDDEVGVIRSLFAQMFLGQISVKILNSIDHDGITLEGNISF